MLGNFRNNVSLGITMSEDIFGFDVDRRFSFNY